MAVSFTGTVVLHEQRIRCVFSEALAPAAFAATSYYSVTSADGIGPAPDVIGAIAVPGAGAAVDLALDTPLATGAAFVVSAPGVPAVDSTVTPPGSALPFFFGTAPSDPNAEVSVFDIDALVFGTDLVWQDGDFVEAANGDLATQSGVTNFQSAIQARLSSPTALLWAPTWGLQGNDYVNGPMPLATTLKGAILRQCCADPRTLSASVSVQFDPNDSTSAYFQVQVTPRGAADAAPVTATVPVP